VQLSDGEASVSAVQYDFASYLVQPVSGVYFEAADRGGFVTSRIGGRTSLLDLILD
jgi:hypothetical protein